MIYKSLILKIITNILNQRINKIDSLSDRVKDLSSSLQIILIESFL